MEKPNKYGKMFDKNSQPKDYNVVENMTNQIRKLGGMLHFTIHKYEDGWMAQCNEIEGIITGGSNTNPSDDEIESHIREAIHTAFNVPVKTSPEALKSSITELTLTVV